jgi:hypothetical protein
MAGLTATGTRSRKHGGEIAVEERDVVAQMTPDEITEAQRLAREWKPTKAAPIRIATAAAFEAVADAPRPVRPRFGFDEGGFSDAVAGNAPIQSFEADLGQTKDCAYDGH